MTAFAKAWLCCISLSLLLPLPALAADPHVPAPVLRDGQHDFDFDVGVWHTHIKRFVDPFASDSTSIELAGTVTVRNVWGGKAQLEEMEVDGPKGHWEGLSLLLYNPGTHQWSQTFANSSAGSLSTSNVGELRDGKLVLIGQDNTSYPMPILVRAVWSDFQADSHRYVESYSKDGGTTWVTSFTADLTRLKQ